MTMNMQCLKLENQLNNITVYESHYSVNDHAEEINPVWHETLIDTPIKYCHYYKSGWGNEFRYVREEVGKTFLLESTMGRSSAVFHPYVVLEDVHGRLYSYNLFYSGNWRFELQNKYDHFQLKIGFESEFSTRINPEETFITPKVGSVLTLDGWNKLRGTWQRFTDQWMKKNKLQQELPVAWNQWWAYEDMMINEQVFLDNMNKAAEMGVDICVLDAGWFGNNQHWFDVRGDWNEVDQKKFPHGIAYLSEKVRGKGMKFGFWVEIEGLGKQSKLAKTNPDFVALRDGEPLGYVCFGNYKAVEWAIDTVGAMIEDYSCDWIKFDFNLDPGYGCDCTGHGHGTGDGLFHHYQGLYTFFKVLNEKYPEVVFENCSSGGQRIDLGILANMHVSFLSDPDYPVHKERCVVNAGEVLPPNRMFHFMPSHTCGSVEERPFPNSDLASVAGSVKKLYTRLGMLTAFGISHRLVEYEEDIIQFLKQEIALFKTVIKPFIQSSSYHSIKVGLAEFHVYEKEDELLLMALSGGEPNVTLTSADLGIALHTKFTMTDIDLKHESRVDTGAFNIDFNDEIVKTLVLNILP